MIEGFIKGVVILLGVLSIGLCFIHAFVWLITAIGPQNPGAPPARRPLRWVLAGVLSSVGSFLLVFILFPLGSIRPLWRTRVDRSSASPPVLLIHGLYHNPSAWLLYRFWLRRAGFENIFYFGYNSWKYSFDELVEQLDEHIGTISEEVGGRPLVLIGHSLGGLLSRACVDCSRPSLQRISPSIAAVITLGAPHQGSTLAILGLGRLARSLAYRGHLITDLEGRLRDCAIPRLAIYSPLDIVVSPPQAARVPYAGWIHMESEPVSHAGLLFHRPTAQMVINYLRTLKA